MSTEPQFIEMTEKDKEFARAALAAAQLSVNEGDLRGFARTLEEAAALAKAAVAERG